MATTMMQEVTGFGTLLLSLIGVVIGVAIYARIIRGDGFGGRSAEALLLNIKNDIVQAERTIREEFPRGRDEAAVSARMLREEITGLLISLGKTTTETITQLSATQMKHLESVTTQIRNLTDSNEARQEILRKTVEIGLDSIRSENAAKLEAMRQTVDEKLQGTLEQRLGASFKIVSDQLESVYKSVGEMQSLAAGVGDLKKVLSNVKTRGTWGEISLGNLLEQMMAPEQFERNVEVRPGSGQRVEFAIRLPGDGEGAIWLPIDAKFPLGDYERLVASSEAGDVSGVEAASASLEKRIWGAASEISSKYISPPFSTDFAIMFLPTESLFAEVIRRPGVMDGLQRDYHVMVAGPTTLVAVLNSLRMGFRTLVIQQRTSDVWRVLAAVKTEFGKFEGVLDRVSKKLQEAQDAVEQVGTRRRAMNRKLRDIEELPEPDAIAVLEVDGLLRSEAEEQEEETEARPALPH